VNRPRSLRGRLAAWYALVISVALLAFGASVYFMLVEDEEEEHAEPERGEQALVARRVLQALAVGLPASLAIAVGGGVFITRRALRPLGEVVRIASDLELDKLARRIPEHAGSAEEIAQLVAALNRMLDRLQRSAQGMARFTADASHELRTPLASLMGNIEVTLRRARTEPELRSTLESSMEELGLLSRLVEALLTLARSDNGQLPLTRAVVELDPLAREVVGPYEPVMAARRLTLTWRSDRAASAIGDAMWLRRVIANLIDNACKFAPEGGAIEIAITSEGAKVAVTVFNSGAVISQSERDRLFERFYRSDAVRGSTEGFGLGLPIARELVRAMGGELALDETVLHGVSFRIVLPSA
jgi:heavy metal sensor kinase